MTGQLINTVIAGPPEPGHRLRVLTLGGSRSLDLVELHERAQRLAVGLTDAGLRAGDRIGILAANSVEWVLLDLAALMIKAVTAGLQPGKFDADAALLAEYDLAAVFTDQPCAGPGLRPMSDVDVLIDGVAAGRVPPPVRYQPDEATTLKFTSGSTGVPKVLAATVGSIDSSIAAVQDMFAHGAHDDVFVFLPLSLLQQRYWVYSALRYGHDVTISTYEAAFFTMPTARPTVVMGVPAFFAAAQRHLEGQAADGDHASAARALFGDRIRYLWTGSAPAARDTLDFFDGIGMPLFEGYGLNETCIVSKNHPGAHKVGSAGRLLPGKRVEFDAAGAISVLSDHPVNVRYEYAPPGESERIFRDGDGAVRTGDLGYLDADGFLFILGRGDDVIVLGNGRKVIVGPMEEYFRTCPAVAECVLFCPDETNLVAVVSPAACPADEAEIAAHLARSNARFARDERISRVVVADEPFSIANNLLTSQFKPRRKQILERYEPRIRDNAKGIHANRD